LVKALYSAIDLFFKTQDGDKDKTALQVYETLRSCEIFFDENKDLQPKHYFPWKENIMEIVGKKELWRTGSIRKEFERWIQELQTKKSEQANF
jgi:hypothetical protein